MSGSGEGAFDPRLAVNDRGDAVVVWNDGLARAEAVTRSAGGSWSPPTRLDRDGSAHRPRVALSNRGKAVAVWFRTTPDEWVVESATGRVGAGWSSPTVLNERGGSASWPQVAMSDRGEAVAVWLRGTDPATTVEAATQPPRGRWSAPQQIGFTETSMAEPGVAVSRDGDAVAVWPQGTGSARSIAGATRTTRGRWSALGFLSGPGVSSFTPRVAVSDRGAAVIVWQRGLGDSNVIEAVTAD
jgi:hypothetical protein